MYKLVKKNGTLDWIERDPKEGDFVIIPERLALGLSFYDVIGSVVIDFDKVYALTFNGRQSDPISVEEENLVYLPTNILADLMELHKAGENDKVINYLTKIVPSALLPAKQTKKEVRVLKKDTTVTSSNPYLIEKIDEKNWRFKITGSTKVVSGTVVNQGNSFWFNMDENLPYKQFLWVRDKVKSLIVEEKSSVAV